MSEGNRSKRLKVGLICAAVLAFAVAATVVLWGLSQKAKYEREADERYKEYAANTYYPERNSCLVLSLQNKVDCIAKASANAREYERGEQDLVSQRVTAIWTVLMGGAAIVGMLISVVGVGLVWTTFQAAKEGNRVARDIGVAQTRAYIDVDPTTITPFQDNIAVLATNRGQSPALHVKYICEIGATLPKCDPTISDLVTTPKETNSDPAYYRAAGVPFMLRTSGFEKLVILIGSDVFIYGMILYCDVFGGRYKRRFCFRLQLKRSESDPNKIADTSYAVTASHNDEIVLVSPP